jgi:hypothetical protein
MAARDRDDSVDRLYQLPLDQFTPARNALAKELKRPQIKELEKPNIAAWAVNQLYWKERAAYDHLTQASVRLRDEHRKLLAGKASDIREAEKTHREATRGAVERIRAILGEGGHATSDATMNAVQETLEALPSEEAPGRLTRPLKRMGFEALAGVSIAAATAVRKGAASSKAEPVHDGGSGERSLKLVKSAADQKREREAARQREQEERERRVRQAQAEKELKAAESAMLNAEEAVKKAEKTLGELRTRRDEAVSEYQRARLRARE